MSGGGRGGNDDVYNETKSRYFHDNFSLTFKRIYFFWQYSKYHEEMMKKYLIILLILKCTLAFSEIAHSDTSESINLGRVEKYHYSICKDETITLSRYVGSELKLSLPKSIKGRRVVDIGPYIVSTSRDSSEIFSTKPLVNIIIPQGISRIGGYAFADIRLMNVSLSNSITEIGQFAFYNNHLTTITIPNSVKSIGRDAFSLNRLERITIGDSVVVNNRAFGFNFNELYNGIGGTFIRENTTERKWIRLPENYLEIDTYIFEDFRYRINENETITITSYHGVDKHVIIPSLIENRIVTHIGKNAL